MIYTPFSAYFHIFSHHEIHPALSQCSAHSNISQFVIHLKGKGRRFESGRSQIFHLHLCRIGVVHGRGSRYNRWRQHRRVATAAARLLEQLPDLLWAEAVLGGHVEPQVLHPAVGGATHRTQGLALVHQLVVFKRAGVLVALAAGGAGVAGRARRLCRRDTACSSPARQSLP